MEDSLRVWMLLFLVLFPKRCFGLGGEGVVFEDLKYFWPISLSRALTMLVKVSMNRFGKVVEKVVSSSENAFVEIRPIF